MGSSPSWGADVSVPSDLDSARAKLVYLFVALNDGATAEELQSELDLSRGTVLSITGTLRKAEHLERTDDGFEIVES